MASAAGARWFSMFSDLNRLSKARYVIDYMQAHDAWRVLIVGTGWRGVSEIMIGTAAPSVVYSDLSQEMNKRPYVCANGLALPFPDKSFDLVFSNAVIEHVGDAADQRQFVGEHQRVAHHCIITTPNRWFPIESHTQAFLRHWSPTWRASRREIFTRLLSLDEFRDLLPSDASIRGRPWSPTFTAAFEAAV